MNTEYDFPSSVQDKPDTCNDDLQIPIYLDKEVVSYLTENCQVSRENLGILVNYLLSRDIQIARIDKL